MECVKELREWEQLLTKDRAVFSNRAVTYWCKLNHTSTLSGIAREAYAVNEKSGQIYAIGK